MMIEVYYLQRKLCNKTQLCYHLDFAHTNNLKQIYDFKNSRPQ